MFFPMTVLIYSPLLLLLAFFAGHQFAKYGKVRPTMDEKKRAMFHQQIGEVYSLLMSPLDERETKIERLWKRYQTKDINDISFDMLGDAFLEVWSAHLERESDYIPTPLSGYTHNFNYIANMYRLKIDNAIAGSKTKESQMAAVKLQIKLDELCKLVEETAKVRIDGTLVVFTKKCLAYCSAIDAVTKDLNTFYFAFRHAKPIMTA